MFLWKQLLTRERLKDTHQLTPFPLMEMHAAMYWPMSHANSLQCLKKRGNKGRVNENITDCCHYPTCLLIVSALAKPESCVHRLNMRCKYVASGDHKEMSSNLADQQCPRILAQMRGGGELRGLSQPMSTYSSALWRSNSIVKYSFCTKNRKKVSAVK